MKNPFNECIFSATALSIPSGKYPIHEILQICVECNEIPDGCSNKVTTPYICFTMPTIHNNKLLRMVLWFVGDFEALSYFGHFLVTVAHKKPLVMECLGVGKYPNYMKKYHVYLTYLAYVDLLMA